MRAVVVREFGGIEKASLADMPKPTPKAGEVLIETRAVSVNFVDLVMMGGTYQFKPPLPFIPGKLPVGVVAATGDGVTKFKVGDHALLMAESAGYSEFAVMPEGQCVKLPPSLIPSVNGTLPGTFEFTLQNYQDVLARGFWPFFEHSIIAVTFSTLLVIALALPCAYGLTWRASENSRQTAIDASRTSGFSMALNQPMNRVRSWRGIRLVRRKFRSSLPASLRISERDVMRL